jgi:hypothetical protein
MRYINEFKYLINSYIIAEYINKETNFLTTYKKGCRYFKLRNKIYYKMEIR